MYLKSNEEAVAALGLPQGAHDLGLRFVESQLAAVPADPGERWGPGVGGLVSVGVRGMRSMPPPFHLHTPPPNPLK